METDAMPDAHDIYRSMRQKRCEFLSEKTMRFLPISNLCSGEESAREDSRRCGR